MREKMVLPRLGETMETGKVAAWLVQPGGSFRRGETIVEIESDKTVVELPALMDAVLMEIIAEAGSEVAVGDALCVIEVAAGDGANGTPGAAVAAAAELSPPLPAIAAPATPSRPPGPQAERPGRVRATPKARQLARARNIDLGALTGTGRRARIETRDLPDRGRLIAADDAKISVTPFGPLAWRSWGDERSPTRFVLVHGFAGDSKSWASFATMLARQGAYVLAPDLPSHGATGIEADSLLGLTQPITAWLETVASSPVELIGHSLGAAVAAGVAVATPRHVAQLSLIAPVGFGTDIDRHFIEGMSEARAPGAIAHLLRTLALNPPPISATQRDMIFGAIDGRLGGLAGNIAVLGRQQIDLISLLADMTMPVRVVWGIEDRILPWSHAGQTPPMIPVHFVQNAGHMVHWDQPRVLVDLLKKTNKAKKEDDNDVR